MINRALHIVLLSLLFLIVSKKSITQYSFSELDSIVKRCPLDSTLFYLGQQKDAISNIENRFRFFINYSNYYRKIKEYEKSLLYLDSSSLYISKIEDKGTFLQQKGLVKHFQYKYSEAINYYKEALAYFESSKKLAATYHSLSSSYKRIGEYDSVYVFLNKALKSLNKEDNPIGYGTVLFTIGQFHFSRSQYDSSYYYYNRSLEIYKEERDRFREGQTYCVLANVYWAQEEFQEALKSVKNSDSIYKIINYKEGHLINLLTISELYLVQKKYDSSLHFLNSINDEIGHHNDKYIEIQQHVYSSLASIYSNQNDRELTFELQGKALASAIKMKNLESEVICYYNFGDHYMTFGDTVKAKNMFLKVYKFRDSIINIKLLTEVCEKLSEIYNSTNIDSSLIFYKKHVFYKDSITNFNVKKEIELYQLKKDTVILSNKWRGSNEVLRQESKRNYVFLFCFSFFLLSIITLIYFKVRRTKKENISLEKDLDLFKNKILLKEKELQKFETYLDSPDAIKDLLDNLVAGKDWAKFIIDFELIYPNYFSKLNLKENVSLTKNDYRIASLMHLKLSNKEMAEILNITLSGIKNAKNRFKSKLN